MKAVREKMIVNNLPDDEKKKYDRFLDNLHTEASIADTMRIEQEEKIKEAREKAEKEGVKIGMEIGVKEGMEMGMKEGEKIGLKEGEKIGERKKAIKSALELIKFGLNNGQISQATDLSESEVEDLRNNPPSE